MPLNGNTIGTTIANLVKAAAPPPGTPVTDPQLVSLWQSIMSAIYADITATAVITTTGPVVVASVTAVTPGSGISGPGAGTTTTTGTIA